MPTRGIPLFSRLSRWTRQSPQYEVGHLQRVAAIESHLARLVEENVRNRTALADELRGEFRLLARTIASTRGVSSPAGEG